MLTPFPEFRRFTARDGHGQIKKKFRKALIRKGFSELLTRVGGIPFAASLTLFARGFRRQLHGTALWRWNLLIIPPVRASAFHVAWAAMAEIRDREGCHRTIIAETAKEINAGNACVWPSAYEETFCGGPGGPGNSIRRACLYLILMRLNKRL